MKHFLFLLLFSFPVLISAQCLNGTYTVGGTAPDYATITSAVSALTTNGVCGPVVFNIRNGTYNQRVLITPIAGSSPVNTITFQSESLDSSLVTIAETSISSANYIVWLNGADNIIFRKLSIQNNAPGTTIYQTTFHMTNNADNIIIENCSMYCMASTNNNVINTTFALIHSTGYIGDSLTIRNNRLIGNNYAISFSSFSAPYPVKQTITDNIITGQYTYGIRIGFASQISVLRNKITAVFVPGLSYYGAITASPTDTAIISQNTISCSGGAIILFGLNSSSHAVVSNNVMYSSSTTNQSQGISLSSISGEIYHNTVRVSNTTSTGTCLFIYSTSSALAKNNIFQSIGVNGSFGVIYLQYCSLNAYVGEGNIFDCGTSNIGRWMPTVSVNYFYPTMFAWNTVTSQDNSSSTALAQFVSTSDSHITTDFSQNATGGVVGGITTDLDGNPRSLTAPYPGAYEHARLIGNDADAQAVRITKMNCPGVQTVKVNVKNRTTTPLTGFQVNWSVNNVLQTPYSWTGSLASMDTALVPVGTFTSANATRYILKAWTSLPNSTTDVFPANDSTRTDTTWTGMSGSYTVGGTAPDFTTITQGISMLKTYGMCGPVTFLLRNGTYTEQVIIDSIYGMSASNTLRLTSQSGDSTQVIWQYTSNNTNYTYVVKLSNASWVTIDHLTLKQLATTYNNIAWIDNRSHDISFASIIFNANNTASNAIYGSLIYSPNTIEKNIHFQSSSFTGGLQGINFANGTTNEKGLEVSNCRFANQVSDILTMLNTSKLLIDRNIISSTGTGYGIHLGVADSCQVSNNILDGPSLTGIVINGATGGNFQQMFVYNNAVNIRTSVNTQTGIRIASCPNINIEFNTVRMTTTNGTAMYISSCSNAVIRSNVFSVAGANNVSFKIDGSNIGLTEDYNAFYATSGLRLMLQSTTYTTLNSWRTATGFSANSIFANPGFLIPNDCHAHQVSLRDHGFFNPMITTDLDGDIKSNPPDIGVDENNAVFTDAEAFRIVLPAIMCAGSAIVPVVIKNQGTTALTQVTINWTVNNVAQTAINWTGSITAGDSVQVNLGTVAFASSGAYAINVITSMPNSISDPFPFNDTARYSIVGTTLNGTYTIGGTTPDFTTFSSAVAALNTRGICGPVTMLIRNGTYTAQTVLNSIAGASPANRIRFISQSGDSSLVTIRATGTVGANYVINLSGANYVTFSKLTFSALSTTYSNVFGVTGNCKSDSIYHCALVAPAASTNASLLFESGTGNKTNFDISGNRFDNGLNAINWNQSGADSNFVVSKNNFTCLANGQTTINGIYGLNFSENKILVGSAYFTSLTGDLKVQKNQINKLLKFDLCVAVPEQRIISNNYVTGSNGASLLMLNSSGFRILNNTFRGTGSGIALTFTSTYYIDFLNNIVNNTTGNLLSSNSALTFDSCDYNNWNNTGSFGTYASVSYPNFAAWIAAMPYDQHSLNVNPVFISPTDLHLQVTSPLIHNALPLISVTDDIDGDPRGSTPDIGADQNPGIPIEAAMQGFSSGPCLSASTPVSVNITNNGSASITSATLNWKVNQVLQAPISWTGTILPGQTLNNVVVGTYPFTISQSYQLKVWVSNPNSQVDPVPANDTIAMTVVPHYNGTYTIGGNSPDFPDPRTAITALRNYGVCGPVILNIRDGVYQDSLWITPIPGSSAINTITFTAESGDSSAVILEPYQFSGSPGTLIYLTDSTSNLIFRKLTFRSGVNLNSEHIILTRENNNITVENSVFRGVHGSPPMNYYEAFIYGITFNPGSKNLIVRNNLFIDGLNGINVLGITGPRITNNVFYQQWATAINCRASDFCHITGNSVEDAGSNPGFIGISAETVYSSSVVTDSTIVADNKVNIHNGTTGLTLTTGTLPSAVVVVRNNVVSLHTNSSSAQAMNVVGDRIRVIHNTVKITGTDCRTAFNSNLTNGLVKNNSFVNYTPGGAACIYSWTYPDRDYNNYYSASPVFGIINFISYPNFSTFQAAVSSFDVNSNNGNPMLYNTPFWHPGSSVLQNAGTPLTSLAAFDIEENPRSSTSPDMGAYEYTLGNDLGIYAINSGSLNCVGSHSVQVNIRNHGASTASAFTLAWTVNGAPQPNFNWTGTLLPGDSITALTVGTFTSASGSATVIVNMLYTGDVNVLNDTIQNDRRSGPLSGDYTIGGTNPDFRMLDEAFTALETNGACGAVRLLIRDGFYFELPDLSSVSFTAANNLTIQSENNDSSLVTIWYYHVYSTNTPSIIQVDSTSYVTFHAIGINNGTTPSIFTSNMSPDLRITYSDHININHSKLASLYPANNPLGTAVLQVYLSDNIHIDSNNIGNTTAAIDIGGGPADSTEYIYISGNTIDGVTNLSYVKNTRIEDNTLAGLLIEFTGDSIFITKNKIYNYAQFNRVYGNSASRNVISNNFFGITAICYDIKYTDFIYNNFNYSTATNSINHFVFDLQSGDHCNVLNNNFVGAVTASGVPARFGYPAPLTNTIHDYNNYWNTSQTSFITNQQIYGNDLHSVSIDPLYISATDLHIQNPLLGGTALPIAGITDDFDGDARSIIAPTIGADDTAALPHLSNVWPGNANKDSIVDNNDLLPVGVHAGQNGFNRASISNVWQGFPSYDWPILQTNGRNLKFTDSDGDGTIAVADTTAIGLNYGQVDLSPQLAPHNNISVQNVQTSVPLFFYTSATTYNPGDFVDVYVWAGDTLQPINQLYGAAFKINFTQGIVNANSMLINYPSSWLCTPAVDAFTLSKIFESQGQADGAVVRNDHFSRTGYGAIAVLRFQVDPTLTQPLTINLSFSDYRLIDSLGNIMPVAPSPFAITIQPAFTSISSATSIACHGGTATVTVSGSGGTAPYTGEGIFTVTAGTYSYTLIDANGDTSITSITVTEPNSISSSQTISLCAGQTLTVGTSTYNATGTYTDVLTTVNGCDSTVTTNLFVSAAIDTSTTVNTNTISANQQASAYQWIDCNNSNLPISGATNQSFTATANGDYAVIITVGSCSDTSACVNMMITDITEDTSGSAILVYPNPSTGQFILELNAEAQVQITDVLGRVIYDEKLLSGKQTIGISEEKSGIYFMKINSGDSQRTMRIILSQ